MAVLTTIEAAELFRPDKPISAVRVRLSGIDDMGVKSQAHVEDMARKIAKLTGLQVDITIGSSPQALAVDLPGTAQIPGIGRVVEKWVQKGAAIHLSREYDKANVVLLGVMLVVCGLYITSATYISTVSRVREMGVLRAIGWSPGTVARLILSEALLIGMGAAAVGLVAGITATRYTTLWLPTDRLLLIFPIGMTLFLAAALVPALQVSRVRPVTAVRYSTVRSVVRRVPAGYVGMAVNNLLARAGRTLIGALCVALSTVLVGLLLLILFTLNSALSVTLLGAEISLQVQGYHWAIVGICHHRLHPGPR